jgi:hypothetical protein
LAGAFFFMLLVLLGQRVWVSIKSGSVKSWAKLMPREKR